MARTLSPEKRTTILEAARLVLLRDGYGAAKMSDIAAEAGVAPGTLYLYFANKEALAGAIGQELLERVSSQYANAIMNIDTLAGVRNMMNWALTIGRQERDTFALMKNTKPDPKAPQQVHMKFVESLALNLRAYMAKGTIRHYDDPENLANVILAIIHRVFMACAIHDDMNPEQVTASAAEVLEHALFDDATLKKLKDAEKS